ncbi:hypothetical protein RchiOBHm_Chr2g0163211 [Rosa chinensis]|uniref:DVL n=1 Tax=Rosa chinensis TaxID=74649 RepID=A0A2P6S372_ROSCH|nr:uncharacterized protein LOC112188763 [Rosa chinensis]PRQ53140.1 hypothetical protein RchiOBHm_Chr2g0163211 [Rosa chinensis]
MKLFFLAQHHHSNKGRKIKSISFFVEISRIIEALIGMAVESSSSSSKDNKRSKVSSRKLRGYLRQQKGRLYIIRRCVVMLLCWHD